MNQQLSKILGIQHPIIVAPMFLISNVEMVKAALDFGATGAIPAMNCRTTKELEQAIVEIREYTNKPFGINLIVNKSNIHFKSQLQVLLEQKVDYIITSLGSPKETIERCKPLGIKVFCDVIDAEYAVKVANMGADAVIAVNSMAGGHCGNKSLSELISTIQVKTKIPIISAGGIAKKSDVDDALELGAIGVSVGTIFLAAKEAKISPEYQAALIEYGAKDIVLTNKISGSHLTVINTPYMKEVEKKTNYFDLLLIKNKVFKKYLKLILTYFSMKSIEKAAFKPTYKSIWCAGPSIEHIHSIRPLKDILGDLV
jgi:nitronate monooxygenase